MSDPMRATLCGALVGALATAGTIGPAHADKSGVMNCSNPSITRPTNQSVISIKDSYPPLSTLLGEEGDVTVSYVVNANGTVGDVKLVQSSGLPRLDEATINAAKQLIYIPAKSAGAAVACQNEMRVSWRLDGETAEQAADRNALNFVIPPKSAWPAGTLGSDKEGVASVGVSVDAQGNIVRTTLLRSSGIPEFDDASLAYVPKLKLKPAQVEGRAASSAIMLVFVWSQQPPTLPHPPVSGR